MQTCYSLLKETFTKSAQKHILYKSPMKLTDMGAWLPQIISHDPDYHTQWGVWLFLTVFISVKTPFIVGDLGWQVCRLGQRVKESVTKEKFTMKIYGEPANNYHSLSVSVSFLMLF